MCRDWKQDGCNHHFPELNKKRNILKKVCGIFTPSRISFMVIALTLFIGVTYLMQANVSATKGYEIKDLENKVKELKEDNSKLNLKYVELQSMANIIEQVPSLNLVATENIEIITPIGSAVALR